MAKLSSTNGVLVSSCILVLIKEVLRHTVVLSPGLEDSQPEWITSWLDLRWEKYLVRLHGIGFLSPARDVMFFPRSWNIDQLSGHKISRPIYPLFWWPNTCGSPCPCQHSTGSRSYHYKCPPNSLADSWPDSVRTWRNKIVKTNLNLYYSWGWVGMGRKQLNILVRVSCNFPFLQLVNKWELTTA